MYLREKWTFLYCVPYIYICTYIYIYHNFLVVLWSCTAIPSLAIYFLAVHRMVRMILCWMMMFYTASEKFWLIKSNMIFQKIYFSLHLPYPTQFSTKLCSWPSETEQIMLIHFFYILDLYINFFSHIEIILLWRRHWEFNNSFTKA